jgi:hypothetical protein
VIDPTFEFADAGDQPAMLFERFDDEIGLTVARAEEICAEQ